MDLGLLGRAVTLFAVTNVDDLVVLAVLLGRAAGRREVGRVVAGQYLGFLGILLVAVPASLGAGLLPPRAVPYLGLLPLLLGLRAAWENWRPAHDDDDDDGGPAAVTGPGVLTVAAVTFANGGDNIGVYVPVFATSRPVAVVGYVLVFLVLVWVWCLAGLWFARRPPVARTLSRWGHVVLPVVLVALGAAILVEGGAFGL